MNVQADLVENWNHQQDLKTQINYPKQRRNETTPKEPGIDPDIAGIVPGPQPNPWLDDLEEEPAEEEEK